MNITKSKDETNKYKSESFNKKERKTIVIYFSWGGSTKYAAEYIKNLTDADIFEITTVKPYPKEYRATTEQARKELNENFLPELKYAKKDLSQYDTVILGYPNWWNTIPQAVKKFIMDNDFNGKTIAPFCTHGGGGEARTADDVKRLTVNCNILKSLVLNGASVFSSDEQIKKWVKNIGVNII